MSVNTKQGKVCRTCMMDTGEMRSLFATGTIMGQTAKLSDVLLACAELQIAKDDGLPQQICMRCVHQVSRAFSFKKQCEKSQRTLLQNLRSLKSKSKVASIPTVVNQSKLQEILGENDVVTLKLEADGTYTSIKNDTDNDIDNDPDDDLDDDNDPDYDDDNDNDNTNDNDNSMDESVDNKTASDELQVVIKNEPREGPSRPALPLVAPNTLNPPLRHPRHMTNQCRTCGKTFNLVSALRLHCFKEHRDTPVFPKCKLCGKTCRSEEQMKRHMNVHNTGKPFQCEQCGKTFCQRAAYVAHTYSHTGERPFLCTECGKTFKQNSELKIHMRMHLDLRPYSCEICGKNYRNSSLFAIHKRVHSGERPFPCTYCEKKFISSSCLKNHIMIHTGEKPFTCDYCGRSFNRSNALRIHRKIHTGERPHVCSVCGKGFIQAHCLQSHMNTHKGQPV